MERQRRTEWFDTSVVLRKIMGHFPHQEILSFSLVNKTWNAEVKSLLKERGNTVAVIAGTQSPIDELGRCRAAAPKLFFRKANYAAMNGMPLGFQSKNAYACDDLVAFGKMLEGVTSIAPYSQLNINIDIDHPASCSPLDDSTVVNLIASKCEFRSLRLVVYTGDGDSSTEVQGRDDELNHEGCSALRLFTLILQRLAPQVVQLALIVATKSALNLPFISRPIPFEFPKLRVLKFGYLNEHRQPIHTEMLLLKEIVQSSPTLERLEIKHSSPWNGPEANGAFVGDFMSTVMKESKALLVWQRVPSNFEQLSEAFRNRLALSFMQSSMGHLDEKRRLLMRNSQQTLEGAYFRSIALLRLFVAETPFTRLQDLVLSFPPSILEWKLPLLLDVMFCKRSWKALFPNLKTLQLRNFDLDVDNLLEVMRGLEIRRVAMESSSFHGNGDHDRGLELDGLSIRSLLDESISDRELLHMLAPVTRVKRLTLRPACCSLPVIFGRDLMGLEVLELDILGCDQRMDTLFCGIYPEEAEQLQRKDLEFLKAVHIVPPRPAITSLRALQNLVFLDPCGGRIPLVISDVTAAICLSRMPGLTVVYKIFADHRTEPILLQKELTDQMKRFPQLKIRIEIYRGHVRAFELASVAFLRNHSWHLLEDLTREVVATMERKQMNSKEMWNSNEQIIRKFLTYFGDKELVLLSMLSRTWNSEAKTLLICRGKTVAKIGTNIMQPPKMTSPVVFEACNVASFSFGPQFHINSSHINSRAGKFFHSLQSRWAIGTKFGVGATIANENDNPEMMPTACKSGTALLACHEMVNFSRMLSEVSGVIPFCGMSINIDLDHDGPCATACKESLVDEIGEHFPIKTLHLELKRSGRNVDGACSAERLIQQLFTANGHQLQEISLAVRHSTVDFDGIFTSCQFPHLRILKSNVFRLTDFDPLRFNTLRSIVERAPNLEEFHGIGLESPRYSIAALTDRLESILGSVIGQSRALLVCQKSVSLSPEIRAGCSHKIAYSSVGMKESFWENSGDQDAISLILLNSQKTLKEAELNLLQLAKALKTGARLEMLETLNLYFFDGWEEVFPELLAAVMSQEAWGRCFPNLKTLSLFQAYHPIVSRHQADELTNALQNVSRSELGDKASLRVTQLMLPGHTYSLTAVELALLLDICQNAKKLSLGALEVILKLDRVPVLPYLLSSLSGIESMESNGSCDRVAISQFDSLFSGVHSDEADELRKKSVEYLKAVHIVPVQTPITHLRRLKSLVFHERTGPVRAGRTFVVSKVSAAICFSRMPGLTIELNSPASFPYGPTKTQRAFMDIMKEFPEIDMKTKQLIAN